ncbi:MAG: hypothetical protein R8M45_05440 [Ghiorsea sp.]
MNILSETSLSRVWKHLTDDQTTVVILTAFRDEIPKKDNLIGNKLIAFKIKSAGFGYFFVDGYFPENLGTDREVNVSEDSIFAISQSPADSKRLITLCHKLSRNFNQDSIIVKEPSGAIYFYEKDGKKIKFEKQKISPNKIGLWYTQLRNNKKANTFIFEDAYMGKGSIGSFSKFLSSKLGKL